MKTKLILAIAAAAAFPIAAFATDEQSTQNPALDKLVTEMNAAPADQKIGAIVSLLNKLVELRTTAKEQTQQTATSEQQDSMCTCCDMMKHDQNQHSH